LRGEGGGGDLLSVLGRLGPGGKMTYLLGKKGNWQFWGAEGKKKGVGQKIW